MSVPSSSVAKPCCSRGLPAIPRSNPSTNSLRAASTRIPSGGSPPPSNESTVTQPLSEPLSENGRFDKGCDKGPDKGLESEYLGPTQGLWSLDLSAADQF